MEEKQFLVMGKSKRMDIKLVATVRSTGACMDSAVTTAKNTIWDMLRGLGFDIDKIELTIPE